MPWPFGKKRKGFFSDDFFGGFEEEFMRIQEEMMREIENAMSLPEELEKKGKAKPGQPFVYGFSIRVGPQGKPSFETFGNVKPKLQGKEGEREPLVDVIEGEKDLTVVVEVPGVSKEDIKLKTTEESLDVRVDTPQRKYSKQIALPCKVNPKSAKASYKNGVLEVKIERAEPKKAEKGTEVKVE
jgi:HSP20 family protein